MIKERRCSSGYMITDYGTNNIVIGSGEFTSTYTFDDNITPLNIQTVYDTAGQLYHFYPDYAIDTDGRIYNHSPNYVIYGSGERTTFEELADAFERAQYELTREDVADGRKHFYQVMDDSKHQRAENIDTEQFNEYLDEWSNNG